MQTASALIDQGVELMLFGMGTVIVFLALLVVFTSLMSSLLQKYVVEVPAANASTRKTGSAKTDSGVDATTIAVISAALHQHRNKQ